MDKNNKLITGYNKSTRILVMIMGILTGLTGLGHGIPEILLGNKPTDDILMRIGAFTIIPNYLITGIFAVIFSLSIVIWVIGFIHKKQGALIYFILSLLLIFVGGGIAIIFGFLLTWGIATRINKPLNWWRKIIPDHFRKSLAKLWLPTLIMGLLLLCTGVGIWIIVTTPGEVHTIGITQFICWTSLVLGALLIITSFVFGFARDIELQSIK